MPPTPQVPTPLVQVRVHAERGPGVPDVVLLAQPTSGGEEPVLGEGADALGVDQDWLIRNRVGAEAGTVRAVPLGAGRPDHGWLLGIGAGSDRDWRRAGAALVRAASERAAEDGKARSDSKAGSGGTAGSDGTTGSDGRTGRPVARTAQVHLPGDVTAEQAAALALGCVVASHRYRVSGTEDAERLHTVRLLAPAGADVEQLTAAVTGAEITGRAAGLARDLANTPSDHKDPAWLADTGARLAAKIPGLRAAVRDEHWLAEHGFGGVLAVGGGSARPPRLLELSWRPDTDSGAEHLVLVGKGITFDTGGISIKPAENMHVMRTDMSGGAAVIAAVLAVAELGLPVRVTGLVPAAENHVSGSAYRPGDVVRHANGTTTEVTNTDAEGRLVLADALAHAVAILEPTALVDVATLTGAMRVALGVRTGALFASRTDLAERIMAAGEVAGEAWWRMPLSDDHADAVRSELADLRQCPPGPGGITAALFLREFTGGLPWAHLDIAGPARAEQSYDEVNAGGTGFATRTLVEFARSFTR